MTQARKTVTRPTVNVSLSDAPSMTQITLPCPPWETATQEPVTQPRREKISDAVVRACVEVVRANGWATTEEAAAVTGYTRTTAQRGLHQAHADGLVTRRRVGHGLNRPYVYEVKA